MKLLSQVTGEECRPPQYLAELVCLRQGKKKHIPTPPKFWNLPMWRKEYARQIGLAHGLLKLFSIESILLALNCKDGSWIFSLSYKGLVDIIKDSERKLAKEEKAAQETVAPVIDKVVNINVAKTKTTRTMVDRLKDLDEVI